MATAKLDYSVIVAGAGFSGVNMVIQLKRKLGITDVMCFEKGKEVGGTWNYNRYPGAACDIPAVFYSYSFNHIHWDTVWPTQPVILKYIKDTITKFGVSSQIQLSTEILRARYISSTSSWLLHLRDNSTGEEFTRTCKVFISAVGVFSLPIEVQIEGLKRFEGRIVHTGSYDETLDVTGKDVVVLGNGCSGTQVVPAIASKVKSLSHFGRSKHWYIPRPEVPQERNSLFSRLLSRSRVLRRAQRWLVFWAVEYGFRMMDYVKGVAMRKEQADASRKYIRETAPSALHEWLVPTFEVGQKRRVFDAEYMQSLDQERITFYPENVKEIKERSVVRENGEEVPADIIISATGFNLQRLFFPMLVEGQDGELVSDHLKREGGAYCYYGTLFSGFPNFGCLVGPNTATGHSSVIFTTECQVNYLVRILEPVLTGRASSVSVSPSAEAADYAWVRKEMKNTVWEAKEVVAAWYNAASVDGKTNTALYPRSQVHFWWRSFFPKYSDLVYSSDSRGSRFRDLSRIPFLPTVMFIAAASALASRRR